MSELENKPKTIRLRVANIMQYEEFLSEEKIKSVLSSYKTIAKYAYIKHDKDIDPKTGEFKKPHWHIVIQFKTPQYLHWIAQWFGIEQQYIEIPKGKNAFIQCVKYLTHEDRKQQDIGKHKYNDDEVMANFDFRLEIENYERKRVLKGGKDQKLDLRLQVMEHGLKLSEIDRKLYLDDVHTLNYCRKEYLRVYAKLPDTRINFYIQGGSGAGKSFSSRALAKSLVDPFDEKKNEEVYFVVGRAGVEFQGYDGQPVIIFDDARPKRLLELFHDASSIFSVFDIIPNESEQNIKYGSVKLINTFFIVNSVVPFEKFVEEICFSSTNRDEPEPDKQMYRRFVAKFNVKPFNYDFFINQQYFNPEEENYKLYKAYENIGIKSGILQASKKWGDTDEFVKLRNKHFELPIKTAKEAIEYHTKPEVDREELAEEYNALMSEETQYNFSLVDETAGKTEEEERRKLIRDINLLQYEMDRKRKALDEIEFKTFNPDLENQTGQNGQNFSQSSPQIFNSQKPPF